ncbi:MAG: spore germination protein, partial [Clostridia bacterium]|nr:spore germination protein [Clostridia bacterium]
IVDEVREKIGSVRIPSLSMGQESLAECLASKQKWNPFPKIRTTERPDRASASVLEGKVLVLTDNTPVAMVFPTAIFDFVQDTNEYYFPPFIGTFLRLIRFLIFMTTLLLIPLWFLFASHPDIMPSWLTFLTPTDRSVLPLLWQILIAELIIDGLKIASLNTPSSLNNAFGIVGALILGEFAVNTHLFVPEVLLYMSFVSVATFVQPSFQLGYTFKLFRLAFILLIEIVGAWGLTVGLVAMLLIMGFTRTPTRTSYLYPLIPWNSQALWRLLVRRSIHPENA